MMTYFAFSGLVSFALIATGRCPVLLNLAPSGLIALASSDRAALASAC
jgi:hypothetical protein